jgi:hypothetical protein
MRAASSTHAPALVRAGYAVATCALACWALRGITGVALPIAAWILPVGIMVLATLLCATRAVRERHERAAWTGQGNTKATRTEVAWCNRPAEAEVLALVGTDDLRYPPGASS